MSMCRSLGGTNETRARPGAYLWCGGAGLAGAGARAL
jgi:hypothetical protein